MSKRSITVLLATIATMVAPATAQAPDLTAETELKITPMKSGTPRHPQGIKLTGNFDFDWPPGEERPVITGARLLLPRGITFNGGRYATCPLEVLRRKGPSGCPKASIIGKDQGFATVDGVTRRPTFVNGGPRRLWAYVTLYRPTLVKAPVAIRITRPRSKQWSYELSVTTPDVLRIVTGIPIQAPDSASFSFGGTRAAKRLFATTESCPEARFRRYVAFFTYVREDTREGEAVARGRIACR